MAFKEYYNKVLICYLKRRVQNTVKHLKLRVLLFSQNARSYMFSKVLNTSLIYVKLLVKRFLLAVLQNTIFFSI